MTNAEGKKTTTPLTASQLFKNIEIFTICKLAYNVQNGLIDLITMITQVVKSGDAWVVEGNAEQHFPNHPA